MIGTAVAQDDDGEMTIVIYVNLEGKHPAKTFKELPREIMGVRARPEVTDPFPGDAGKADQAHARVTHRKADSADPARHIRRLAGMTWLTGIAVAERLARW